MKALPPYLWYLRQWALASCALIAVILWCHLQSPCSLLDAVYQSKDPTGNRFTEDAVWRDYPVGATVPIYISSSILATPGESSRFCFSGLKSLPWYWIRNLLILMQGWFQYKAAIFCPELSVFPWMHCYVHRVSRDNTIWFTGFSAWKLYLASQMWVGFVVTSGVLRFQREKHMSWQTLILVPPHLPKMFDIGEIWRKCCLP